MTIYGKFLRKNVPTPYRFNFTMCVLMQLFGGIFGGCYSPFYGVIAREQYHADPFWIGLIFASMNISGILSFIVASFTPQGKENKIGFIAYIIASFFLIFSPLAKTGPVFCVMLFLFHVAACYCALEGSVYGYIFPMNIRASLLGYIKTVSSLTSMVLTLLVGMIINMTWCGVKVWSIIFVLAGIFHFLRGVFFKKINIKNVEKHEKINFWKNIIGSFQLIYKEKFNIIIIISTTFAIIALQIFNTVYPMYQVDVLHINGKEVSILTVIGAIFTIIAYPLVGNFVSNKNPVKVWLAVYPLAIILPLFYVFCGKTWYPLILGYILNPVFGVASDLLFLNLVIYLGGDDKIKDYQGLNAFLNGIKAIIALYVGTLIINHCEHLHFAYKYNLKIAILVGIVLMLCASITTLGLLKYRDKK